jgi:mono/diheme cytochrome c family protein
MSSKRAGVEGSGRLSVRETRSQPGLAGVLRPGVLASFLWMSLLSCEERRTERGEEVDTGADTQAGATQDTAAKSSSEAGVDTAEPGPGLAETGPDATPPAPGQPQPVEPSAGEAAGEVTSGWKQYAVHCERCHGQDALGSALAPDLRKTVKSATQEAFAQTVMSGLPDKGMPGFQGVLDPQQVGDIYAYLRARSTGALGPGRP